MATPVVNDPISTTLPDPWERAASIPLDGVLEENRYGPLVTSFFALILALFLSQIIVAVSMVGLLMVSDTPTVEEFGDFSSLFEGRGDLLLIANSIGLFMGLGVFGFALTRLHTTRPWSFLRLRKPDGFLLVLSIVGLFVLMPVVQWLGTINKLIPIPEFFRNLDAMSMELIEQALVGDYSLLFLLTVLAITPALWEELFFRGYVQRQFERGFGAIGGVVATGVIFGLFHFRFTQALPLAALGVYLAFLAWQTGSLWVPVVVHFVNNAFTVAMVEYVKNRPDLDITNIEEVEVPWYLVVVGLLFFVAVVYALRLRAKSLLAQHPVVSSA